VSRKTKLTKAWYEKIVTTDTALTALQRETMALSSRRAPTLVTTTELYVDVHDPRS
jgi:hypothetical protein